MGITISHDVTIYKLTKVLRGSTRRTDQGTCTIKYNPKINKMLSASPKVTELHPWQDPSTTQGALEIMSLGAAGLKEAAQVAVLNNNYLLEHIKKIKGAASPYSAGKRRIEQVRYTWEQLTQDTGVTTEDVTCRMADFGFHLWSSHHPFVVLQPFTIEPTEAYSKDELDE